MPVTIAVLAEHAPGENRVALVPEVVAKLTKDGMTVIVEKGAGAGAFHSDQEYKDAGATVSSAADAVKKADVLVSVQRPAAKTLSSLKKGQAVLGLLDSRFETADLDKAEARGVSVLSLDRLPRQLSRAQTMDALSSQASIAGYRAGIVAAETFGRYFPMMITAAGTARPATVLVLGAGVAGLQAIGTTRRLGAQVSGYDVRPAAQEEVTSLGATFLTTSIDAVGEGGYARKLTAEEAKQQQAELGEKIRKFNVVITTAQVPGGKPPALVSKDTVAAMKAGSVIIDMAAGPHGGNVAGSKPDATVVTKNGVTIIGAGSLPAQMASGASAAYARNIAAVLALLVTDGGLTVDASDEVIGALLVGAPTATEGAAS